MRILLTGGSGKLGTELQKLRKFDYVPTHEEMDITDFDSVAMYMADLEIDLIVHAAAYTNVLQAETDRLACYETNVAGTENLSLMASPMLYISSEYAAFPDLNHYSLTKRIAERYADKSLRLVFKPRPFPHERAFIDQFTSGDYVDVIAREVNTAIDLVKILPPILNIGTGRKSIYDLAKQTRPDIQPMSRTEVKGVEIPPDTSMDCSEWERIKREAQG